MKKVNPVTREKKVTSGTFILTLKSIILFRFEEESALETTDSFEESAREDLSVCHKPKLLRVNFETEKASKKKFLGE